MMKFHIFRCGGGGWWWRFNWFKLGWRRWCGGFREENLQLMTICSTLSGTTGITVTATTYPITVGGGGVEKVW